MTSLIPECQVLLVRTAERRAVGMPWADVAAELAIDVQTLRRLVSGNQREYDRLIRWAKREFRFETMAQTVATLRGLLRSQDEEIVVLAATAIMSYELARIRQDLHGDRNKLRKESERLRRSVSHLARVTVTAESTRCDSEPRAT